MSSAPSLPSLQQSWSPQQWIDYAWSQFPAITPDSKRAQYAWAWLQSVRVHGAGEYAANLHISAPNIPNADKLVNLAYAEHYMYSRYVVSVSGDDAGQNLITYGYEGRKAKAFYLDKNTDPLKVSPYNPVPPSTEALDWAMQGAARGLKDWTKEHPGETPVFGKAIRLHTEIISHQMGLKDKDQKQLEQGLDTVIQTQKNIQKNVQNVQGKIRKGAQDAQNEINKRLDELRAIIQILQMIQRDFPKTPPNSDRVSCSLSNPDVETNVSGTILNSSPDAGSDPGILA